MNPSVNFEVLLKDLPAAIIFLNDSREILYSNQLAQSWFATPGQSLQFETLLSNLPSTDPEGWDRFLVAPWEPGGTHAGITEVTLPDQPPLRLLLQAITVNWEHASACLLIASRLHTGHSIALPSATTRDSEIASAINELNNLLMMINGGLSSMSGSISRATSLADRLCTATGTPIDVSQITLPVFSQTTHPPRIQSDVKTLHPKHGILVVDDEELLRELVESYLTQSGHPVFVAESADRALEVFTQNPDKIQLVLLDMILPGMNGLECMKALKKIDPKLKVILMSGYALDSSRGAMISEGANGFLKKPFPLDQISGLIRSVME